LAAVDRVAELPAAGWLPAVRGPGTVLGVAAAKRGVAVPGGRDGTGDHALALAVTLHRRAELLDHAHRLVADRKALRDRVLTLEDVHVGAADRGGRDPYQRIQLTDVGDRLLVEHNATWLNKGGGSHPGHVWLLEGEGGVLVIGVPLVRPELSNNSVR
jgi:hypothetical protein